MKKILLTLTLALSLLPAGSQTMPADTASAAPAGEFAALTQADTTTKQQADSAYIREDYASAIQIYEALLQEGEAAEVYYNLGNAYFKTDNLAKAILNYERALLLSPGNADVRANLEIARAKTVDKVVGIPEIFFVAWIKAFIDTQSVAVWARLAIASFLLLLVALGLFFFAKPLTHRKIGFFSAIVLLLLTITFHCFASVQRDKLQNRTEAIILSPSITVRSTPSDSGTALFILHEGHKVQIRDNSMREWKEISIEDGKVGWIPASAMETI